MKSHFALERLFLCVMLISNAKCGLKLKATFAKQYRKGSWDKGTVPLT